MIISITYTTGTPNPEVISGATVLRTVAFGANYRKEGSTRQISSIEITPANINEEFTLEVRPGTGVTKVKGVVIEGSAASSDLIESVGGVTMQGSSVLCDTNTSDNLIKLKIETPPDVEAVQAQPASDAPEDDDGDDPDLIFVRVKVKHPV